MKRLNSLEKLRNSIINVSATITISISFLIFAQSNLQRKLILISAFLFLNLIVLFRKDKRTLGMILTRTKWKENYPRHKYLLHSVFYTISFSTLLFYIWIPFDIFLINIFLIQLPTMLIKKMTFHEFLAGEIIQVKD